MAMGYVDWKFWLSPSFNNDMKAMVTYDRNLNEFFRSKFIFFQAHLNLKAVVDKK